MRERRRAFWCGNLRVRVHLQDPGLDVRIILKWKFRNWEGGAMDWVDLAQERERWWAVVNVVMNFRAPKKCGNFLTS